MKAKSPSITVRLDRVRRNCWAPRGAKVPNIPGFKVVRDFRLNSRGGEAAYERVRKLKSLDSDAEANWEYRRTKGWLRPQRVTLIADDATGLTPKEVYRFFRRCQYGRLLIVELAIDFDHSSVVDCAFVKRHGRFGKSRRRRDLEHHGELRYGDRRAGKYVRAYWKKEVNAFRVELELHCSLLREFGIRGPQDFTGIASAICPAHICFVRIRWAALQRYLRRRFGIVRANEILEGAREKSKSLHAAMRFLREQGTHNPHRFLRPLKINKAVKQAIADWAVGFAGAFKKLCLSEMD